MKRKLKPISLLLILVFVLQFAFACGKSIQYSAETLTQGQVGIAYSADVNKATGSDNITYALKGDNALPSGLELSTDGKISGTPTEAVNDKAFTIVASAEGAKSAEAEFKITISEKIIYEGGTLTTAVNAVANLTVATATGPVFVTYTKKSGELQTGLTFTNGAITGTATTVEEKTIVVTASATGFEPVDATWIIKVTEPMLVYEDFTAANGTVGIYYTSLISKATGTSNVTYKLADNSILPEGLVLEEDGFLHGAVSKAGNTKFKVVAKSNGFIDAIAEISLLMRNGDEPLISDGTISYTGKTLPKAMQDINYISLSTANADETIATATSSNFNVLNYVLAEASVLPKGLVLYKNGTIYGTPTEQGKYSFSITASADKCAPVTVKFSLTVSEPKVIFETYKQIPSAVVGSDYTNNLGGAVAGDEIVKYTVKSTTPQPEGLSLSTDGILSGKPTTSARSVTFIVVASATGFTPAECEVSIKIIDKEVVVSDGKLEAEYIDLTNKNGSGYSGAASEEAMVQPGATYDASNDRYIGYTHCQLFLEFKFKSSVATSGVKLDIALACELGNVTFTPNQFEIMLNGISIDYSNIAFKGTSGSWTNFSKFNISSNVSLKEGENTIVLIVKENTFLKGQSTGGPGIDYIQFTSSSSISWTPCLYNIKNR